MRNLKDKFKNKINFVKPLYKKVYPNPKNATKCDFASIDIDNAAKLCGYGFGTTKNNIQIKPGERAVSYQDCTEKYDIVLPGTCLRQKAQFTRYNQTRLAAASKVPAIDMMGISESKRNDDQNTDKHVNKKSEMWLRVHPAPLLPDESFCSVFFRCLMCQMGISTFLCVWTLVWMIVIHYFEGPFEKKVSQDFKEQQSQLIIDLATELRQITPVSPKWRKAIEDRIEAERILTIAAVGRGARLHPGHFWDLPGTFLFTVYVLTALGFGAPVPQTMWGRGAALIYAIVAVPSHIYLMIQLSTCVVVHVEYYMQHVRSFFKDRMPFDMHKNGLDNKKESPNCSSNSVKSNKSTLRKRLICIFGVFCMGRGVPLAVVLYYVLGLTTFGIARAKQPLEVFNVVLFPLEFTTTGGLEHVECYVRILYGIYVEGAMILLSCLLATLRRNCTSSANNMADRYRLFASEDSLCKQ